MGDYAPTPYGGTLKIAFPLDSWQCYAYQLSPWSFGRYRACPRSIYVIWSSLLARCRLHICTCACVLCPYGHRPTGAGSRKGSPPFAPRSGVPRPSSLLPAPFGRTRPRRCGLRDSGCRGCPPVGGLLPPPFGHPLPFFFG